MRPFPFSFHTIPRAWALSLGMGLCFFCLCYLPAAGASAAPVPVGVTPAAVIVSIIPDTGAQTPAFLQIGGPSPFAEGEEPLEVFFLDVDQGDAIFLRLGSQTLLIDGGYPESFPRLHRFLLEEQGALEVGSLLFTHPHVDHISGPTALLRQGGRALLAYGPLAPESSNLLFGDFLAQLKARSIPYARLRSGDLLELGGQGPDRGATLIPGEDLLTQGSALLRVWRWEDSTQDVNARSLVIHVEYGLRTLLLTADITGVAQHHFFNTQGFSLASDILKSPHHGVEPFQSDFLSAVSPSLVVMTNTPKSSQRAGAQLARRGIPALYSGEGTLYLATDGERWYVRQEE